MSTENNIPQEEVTPLQAFELIFEALEKVAAFPLETARKVDAYAELVRGALEEKRPANE